MNTQDLKTARLAKGWSQTEAAERLGLSQSYLAMLESGQRRFTPRLVRRLRRLLKLPPTVLPLSPEALERPLGTDAAQTLTEELGALGYPGFAYLGARRRKRNPAEVLLISLAQPELEARVVEALPWLLLNYWDTDTGWLVEQAKLRDLQNRLGFVVSLARGLSERMQPHDDRRVQALGRLESTLERSRLAREDSLGKASLTERERRWLTENRPEEARHWNLMTDWRAEMLPYGV